MPVNSIVDIANNFFNASSGKKLKKSLGLINYPYVMIQKIIGAPVSIFVATYDSRRPTIYLSPVRIKNSDSCSIFKVDKAGILLNLQNYKMTPPLPIEYSNIRVGSNTIIILRDLAGEYLKNRNLNEKNQFFVYTNK